MEQFGSVFWYLGAVKDLPAAIKFKNIKKNVNRFLLKKIVICFEKKRFFCSSLQSAHRHRHDEHIILQTWSATGAPGANRPFQRLSNSKKFKKAVFYLKENVFFCFCFFRILSQSAHGHRPEEHIMLQTRSAAGALARSAACAQRRRLVDPSRKKLVARAKRGSRALTRRGE